MNAEKIQALIAELERELEQAGTIDSATRAELEKTLLDLKEAVGEETPAPPHESLMERLQTARTEFESAHPALTGTFQALVDALQRIGI